MLGYVEPDREYGRLESRRGIPLTDEYPEVARELAAGLLGHSAIVDGELVAIVPASNGEERDSIAALRSKRGNARLYIFDLLYLDRQNTMRMPLHERRDMLQKVVTPSPHVRLSEMFYDEDRKSVV